jgi:hypothetical protein
MSQSELASVTVDAAAAGAQWAHLSLKQTQAKATADEFPNDQDPPFHAMMDESMLTQLIVED